MNGSRRQLPRLLATAVWLAGAAVLPAQTGGPGVAGVTPSVPDQTGRPVPRDPRGLEPLGPTSFSANRTQLSELLPIYFPALPPVLGAELPAAPAVRDGIWSELAPFANEPFYAPLSTRFAQGNLNRRHRQRLDAYKSARDELLTELRASLGSAPAERAERGRALAALAVRQQPKLAELAGVADELRREIYRGSFLVTSGDWNMHRNWQLGDGSSKRTPQETLFDEMSVVRAAIYYQEGLSAEQRELLREIVIEISEALGDGESSPLADTFEPEETLFFLPHGSRLRVPAGLPADARAAIAAFTAAKNALKRELRDALFQLDREGDSRRQKALEELAARQAPRFAELEAAAAPIRDALARLPDPRQPAAPSGLPPELSARIDAYLREKTDLQRDARRQADGGGTDSRTDAGGREALLRFEESNRARLARLTAEARAIREELARAAAARTVDTAGKSVDALLADFLTAFKHQQALSLYRDYRAALLEPGLSPAQRQLLFNAAIASLDLTGTKDWQAVPE